MKALTIDGYGMEHVALREVPDPQPAPGEVIVRMRAASVNRLDLWTLSGALKIPHEFPHVLGADGAGVVETVGDGVGGIRPGAEVMINPGTSCGRCEFCRAGEQSLCTDFKMLGEHMPGTFAELVSVKASNVFPFPNGFTFAQAAALGTTFITAYRMLFTRGRMTPGEWVLVTGIGGGLGVSLFQLARPLAGKLYVTSSSADKIERARGMGADGAVNYREEDPGKAIRHVTGKRGVDLVVDSAAGDSLEPSLRALRRGGRLVNAGATAGPKAEIDMRRVFWNQIEIIGSTMGSDADVSDMLRMVSGTGIEPVIDRPYPLSDGIRALERLDEQDHFGKVVLEVS